MPSPIPQMRLWAVLDYSDETGLLFWRRRPVDWFDEPWHANRWNSRFAGKEALKTVNSRGYKKGAIFGKTYYAHQVIWCWKSGEWPNGPIDHIDSNRANNKWSNLQIVTYSENAQKAQRKAQGSSKFRGVCYDVYSLKWRATICASNQRFELGFFGTQEEAAKAYDRKAKELHGRFAQLNYPEMVV